MQNSTKEEDRNVVPRWRSVGATSAWELRPARVVTGVRQSSVDDYSLELEIWRSEKNLEAAADIFSVGIATGRRALVWEGALQLINQQNVVEPQLIEAAKHELRPARDPIVVRDRLAPLEQNEQYLRHTIRLLKKRLIDGPRDAISTLELARHYTILGQYEAAAGFIHRAHALAPGSRMVLRALVQFYDVVQDINAALPLLWQSPGLRYDPLIQSAEMAAAEIGGRSSRSAAAVKRNIKGLSNVEKATSEAALALATLERHAGAAERSVFKLVGAGLSEPTENAMAQAVWLSEQSTRRLAQRFPRLEVQAEAYEARAYLLFEAGQYEMALGAAQRWSRDQPFQSHAMAFICTTAAVYTDRASRWIPVVDAILQRHFGDFGAVNAALLCFALGNEPAKAKDALSVLKRLARSEVELAFASAGSGLLQYGAGDALLARRSYEQAMRHAQRAKRRDLVFTAAAFYVLGEARYGTLGEAEITSVVETLDRLSSRVPNEMRQDTDRLWSRVKQVVTGPFALTVSDDAVVHESPTFASVAEIFEEA